MARAASCGGEASGGDFVIPVSPQLGGFANFCGEEHLSDLRVSLPDDTSIPVHRIVLAAVSGVLRAKYCSAFADAREAEWRPRFGSAAAWRWLIRWAYGCKAPLPAGLVVEAFVLADHLQISGIVDDVLKGVASLGAKAASRCALQILDAWACPVALHALAKRCVPSVTIERTLVDRMRCASLPNLALFIKYLQVPFMSEHDRLCLLGLGLRATDGSVRYAFAECCLDAVHWEEFPTSLLEEGVCGNFGALNALLGQQLEPSENVRLRFAQALARRCRRFEDAALACPQPQSEEGVFSRMLKSGINVHVCFSSVFEGNRSYPPFAVLTPGPKWYGTDEQSWTDEPWIELSCPTLSVCPRALCVRHGAEAFNCNVCQSYVFEAAVGQGEWTELFACSEMLSVDGPMLIGVPSSEAASQFYNRFRLRMTGPDSSGRWFLCIAWMDVLGSTRRADVDGWIAEEEEAARRGKRWRKGAAGTVGSTQWLGGSEPPRSPSPESEAASEPD